MPKPLEIPMVWFMFRADGFWLTTFAAIDAISGAGTAAPAVTGIATGSLARTQGARRTGTPAKSRARRGAGAGSRVAGKILG